MLLRDRMREKLMRYSVSSMSPIESWIENYSIRPVGEVVKTNDATVLRIYSCFEEALELRSQAGIDRH